MTEVQELTDNRAEPVPQWEIGDAMVCRVDELAVSGLADWLLPQATPELVAGTDWLRPSFADDQGGLLGSVHTFAVRIGDLRVLVDTGVGNDKTRPIPFFDHLDTPFLERLTRAGFAPPTVDMVINTHLHMDHIGWNTRLEGGRWVPTFPNARYLVAHAERDYWTEADLEPARRQMFIDSVDPLTETGQLDPVEVPPEGVEVAPGLRLLPTPGHTPGQVAVQLHSAGRSALITGDCMHHPVQLAHPDLCSAVDVDSRQAVRTRRALLAELAGSDTLVLGSHFPSPTAGRVRPDGDGYRLIPGPATAAPAHAGT